MPRYTIDEIYHQLETDAAFETWSFPDGPWGWNEDGTSKAPDAFKRECHIHWYHDMVEGNEEPG